MKRSDIMYLVVKSLLLTRRETGKVTKKVGAVAEETMRSAECPSPSQ